MNIQTNRADVPATPASASSGGIVTCGAAAATGCGVSVLLSKIDYFYFKYLQIKHFRYSLQAVRVFARLLQRLHLQFYLLLLQVQLEQLTAPYTPRALVLLLVVGILRPD